MDKRFTIQTTPVLVDAIRVPTLYRVDFSGPAEVASIEIPYDALEPRVASFAVAGDYNVLAGLYDADGKLMGSTASENFHVDAGDQVSVNAVEAITVEPV
jgi:hypothetical protein